MANHPEDHLKWEASRREAYTCAVCKFIGLGPRYRCKEGCDIQVHECCTRPRPTFIKVPLSNGCRFEFLDHPPKERGKHCAACGTDVEGCAYRCHCCDKYLHPCCAYLKDDMIGDVPFLLRKKAKSECMMCNMKGLGTESWWYVSEDRKFNLHVHCAIKLLRRATDGDVHMAVENITRRELELHARGKKREKGLWTLKNIKKIVELLVNFLISLAIGNPATFLVNVAASTLRG